MFYNVFEQIWFPGTKEGEMQKMILENDGYRLTSLCGYSVRVSNRQILINIKFCVLESGAIRWNLD